MPCIPTHEVYLSKKGVYTPRTLVALSHTLRGGRTRQVLRRTRLDLCDYVIWPVAGIMCVGSVCWCATVIHSAGAGACPW